VKCLWIARDLPFPLDAGDKIYSAHLARSLAESGAHVRFLGFPAPDAAPVPSDWPIEWRAVQGPKRGSISALFSPLPSVAAVHAVPAYKRALDEELTRRWDVIVFDNYGSGWALQRYLALHAARHGHEPTLVYVSHNHEASVWRSMVRNAKGSWARRAVLWQNYLKARALERMLTRHVRLIATITEEDRAAYLAQQPDVATVVLPPGYCGTVTQARSITLRTPRRVAMVGSFRWLIKQENLRQFIHAADASFAAHDIGLDVIGETPGALREELQARSTTVRFHGFVADPARQLADARIAVVPELIGGGFKLKFLDYIFGRVPVAAIDGATAGLPASVREHVLSRPNLQALVDAIVANIGDTALLDRMQAQAHAAASSLFNWSDRGVRLREAIEVLR
jgi:glycosyltransferase involved in cell wall biosynthesis